MKPQTIIPLVFAPRDVRLPTRAAMYLHGEIAEGLSWCKEVHGKTWKLGAPLSLNSAHTLDQLIDLANGDAPRGTACGANLCRGAITEMGAKFGFSRQDPYKLFWLYYFRPPLPEWDKSFYGGGGQDGRKDWTGLDVPDISGMCYTSDHKPWLMCGESWQSLEAKGWAIPEHSRYRRNRVGSLLHEAAHASGVNWHTADNVATPEDERYQSPMWNYFNFPQMYSPADQWLWQQGGSTSEGVKWVRFLPDEWAALEAAGGLTA